MMKKKAAVIALLLGVFCTFVFVNKANAIPTFARKYRTSCMTCHIGFNKLNAFGESFRLNGYNVPEGDAAYVKEEPVSLGAKAWEKVWPDAVWPGVIPQTIPISFMVHQRINVEEDNETSTFDFNTPHEFELLMGGTFGDFASFFGEYVLDEDGAVEGVEQMFIQFNDLFYANFGNWLPENALNIKMGKFQVAAEPFYEPSRRTLQHLQINNYNVGLSDWQFRDNQSGVEANGILFSRLRYAFGVVNGNGAVQDNNHAKDGYYRLSYKWGGMAFDGTGAEELGEELKQTNNWVDDSVTLGTFGYLGTSNITTTAATATAPVGHVRKDNQFYRVGGDLRISYGNLDLYGAGVFGEDYKAFNIATRNDINSFVWFVGGDYVIYPWLTASARYEQEEIYGGQIDVDKFVYSLAAFPRANVRCIVEFSYYPESDGEEIGNNLLQVDVAYLF